jgi:hypothetical protein
LEFEREADGFPAILRLRVDFVAFSLKECFHAVANDLVIIG